MTTKDNYPHGEAEKGENQTPVKELAFDGGAPVPRQDTLHRGLNSRVSPRDACRSALTGSLQQISSELKLKRSQAVLSAFQT